MQKRLKRLKRFARPTGDVHNALLYIFVPLQSPVAYDYAWNTCV